ncbi:hypothetical protein PILCRDRAFT_1941, partial [Piloderma croceum F 1598]
MPSDPHIIYANALSTKRESYGYPLWEPDPAGQDPVELTDVGYIFRGRFVKLFNGFSAPEGFERLDTGEVIQLNPLPMIPEEIASRGVRKVGGSANLSLGERGGGSISFDCAETDGAVLLLGADAQRKDALETLKYREYIVKNHDVWLQFARSVKGRDISLEDLILVTGCDMTSKWACATWSEKTKSATLTFSVNAGV